MRTLCDVCESAAAILFCAADEAALCSSCDHKICFYTIGWMLNAFELLCGFLIWRLIHLIKRGSIGTAEPELGLTRNWHKNKQLSTQMKWYFAPAICTLFSNLFMLSDATYQRISYFGLDGLMITMTHLFMPFLKVFLIHMCNKLASRHIRVGLADPTDVPRCDICENAPAFFYCEVDGSSLCLQCDMTVHVGGKRTHERYLLLRQRVEFPGDKPAQMEELGLQPLDQNELRRDESQSLKLKTRDSQQNHSVSPVPRQENNIGGHGKIDKKLIDLNTRPLRLNGPAPNNQEQGMDILRGNNHESAGMPPVESFKQEAEK